jgi:hypothetical protein
VSSAILYVAIVAIWACVLIPRWLRRDSARGASGAASETVPDGTVADTDGTVAETNGTVSGTDGTADSGAGGRVVSAGRRAAGVNPEWLSARVEAAERRVPSSPQPSAPQPPSPQPPAPEEPADEAPPAEAPPSQTPEETRHRMLAARRRLLGMLLVLEAAAIALALLGLAALWVIIPPTVMLAGYLLVLREAAHADVERAAHDQEAARARARAQERASARDRARARAAQRPPAAMAPTGVPATPAAPAAPAAGYEEAVPGRDFAPGLAGKYTTSNADAIDGSNERGDERYLRAVGD